MQEVKEDSTKDGGGYRHKPKGRFFIKPKKAKGEICDNRKRHVKFNQVCSWPMKKMNGKEG